MIIKGIIDLDSGNFLNDQGTADMGAISIQAQETVEFMLRFQVNGSLITDVSTIDELDVVFAAKPTPGYTGTDYYVYKSGFNKNSTTIGYDAVVDFYTAEVVTGIANTATLSMHGQFKVNDYPDGAGDGHDRFSQLIPITISNSVVAAGATAGKAVFPRIVTSSSAPAATDDITEGYDLGSAWIVTGAANAGYVLIDNTEDAAIWSEMTSETASTTYNNLGIGITSPSAPIHVKKAATTSNQRLEMMRLELVDEGVDMNVGHGPGIDFYVGETSGSGYGGTLAVVREQAADANDAAAMVFHTTTDDGVADPDKERMRITSDGKVGIGTNNPSYDLEVSGGAYLSGSVVSHVALNAQTGTTYTLVLADSGKMITSSNGSAQTITVPANSSVAFPVGTQVLITAIGAGIASIAAAGGVTIRSADSALKLRTQYSTASLIKVATDEWYLSGDLTTY